MADRSSPGGDLAVRTEAAGAVELSIVMPCLNEAETVEVCVRKAKGWLEESKVNGEVVVADNGSTDGSQAAALRANARVVHVEAKGYGSALMGGISAALGKYVIMGDADDSYDLGNLGAFLDKLRAGYHLVMGDRFAGGIGAGAMPALHKYVGNPVLTGIGRLLFRSPCRDFHCGLRGFDRDAILKLDLRTTGMEFASEMVVKATLRGLRITDVPTRLSPAGRTRPPHLRTWRDGWRHLRFLLLYSPRWLFLYPGALLMVLSSIAGLWLLRGPVAVGAVAFDVQTLLYAAAAAILGFQAVLFAVLTKVFASSEGLLPEDPRFAIVFRYITLEVGLIAGCLLALGGVVGSLYAVGFWSEHAFGALDTSRTLRFIIPSVAALILGGQVILSSLFLSVLGLKRR